MIQCMESNVRGLSALGFVESSYGGLLSPISVIKMPPEFHFIMSCELSEEEWDLESVMDIFQREIEAREHSTGATLSQTRKPLPTVLSLVTGANSALATCTYCSQPHLSDTCQKVREPEERKQVLRAGGCCFVCLRQNHLS